MKSKSLEELESCSQVIEFLKERLDPLTVSTWELAVQASTAEAYRLCTIAFIAFLCFCGLAWCWRRCVTACNSASDGTEFVVIGLSIVAATLVMAVTLPEGVARLVSPEAYALHTILGK